MPRPTHTVQPVKTLPREDKVPIYRPLNIISPKPHLSYYIEALFQGRPPLEIPCIGGRLRFFTEQWGLITGDPMILEALGGYKIPLLKMPSQTREPNPILFSWEEKRAINREIEEMISEKVIKAVAKTPNQLVSNLFARPKKDEERVRPILNLRPLNREVGYQHFKMDSLESIKNSLRPSVWMVKIDLKSAFWHLPIWEEHKQLLRFNWEGTLYQMEVLPFGLGSAPRIWTKIMKAPIGFLRKLGMQIAIYLDDMLIVSNSLMESVQDRDIVMFFLEQLGLVVNLKKSVLTPSRQMEYLGFILDSENMEIRLSLRKASSISDTCLHLMNNPTLTLRELCSLIGKLYAVNHAVALAPLQIRSLQMLQIQAQKSMLQYGSMVTLNQQCLGELNWWVENLTLLEGKAFHLEEPDLILYSDAATSAGWGAHTLGGGPNGGFMAQRRKNVARHKRIGAHSSRKGNQNLYKRFSSKTCAYFYRQHNSLVIPEQKGGHEKSKFDKNCKKNLVLGRTKAIFDHGTLDSLKRKHPGGLPVETGRKRRRLAPPRGDFQTDCQGDGNPISRRIRFAQHAPTDALLELGPRPKIGGNKCFGSELEPTLSLPFPPFLFTAQGTEESSEPESGQSYFDSSTLARPTLVPNAFEHGDKGTNPSASGSGPVNKSHEGESPSFRPRKPQAGGIPDFQQRLVGKGLSAKAAHVIANSRRKSSTRTYQGPWSRWVHWCDRRDFDPFTTPVENVINFLTDLFDEGLKYRTLGVYRSAISAYHDPINGLAVGELKEVSTFMSGVDNIRPAVPKFCTIWDVDAPINYLSRLGEDSNLSWEQLNLKLSAFLAIVNFKRASDLYILDTKFCVVDTEIITFHFQEKPKHHRKKGVCPKPISFKASPGVGGLCPVKSIKHYLDITKTAREESGETRLFLSHLKPHKAVTTSTIRRWLKTVLQKSGIDTEVFQGHSFRHAASSKARDRGASISEILERGGWGNSSTWKKFYHRDIV